MGDEDYLRAKAQDRHNLGNHAWNRAVKQPLYDTGQQTSGKPLRKPRVGSKESLGMRAILEGERRTLHGTRIKA